MYFFEFWQEVFHEVDLFIIVGVSGFHDVFGHFLEILDHGEDVPHILGKLIDFYGLELGFELESVLVPINEVDEGSGFGDFD